MLTAMRHLDLFSGIGTFALAAQQVWERDYECIGFCDTDWFCRMVLHKHFPGVPIYGDINVIADSLQQGLARSQQNQATGHCGQPYRDRSDQTPFGAVDLLTGGPPCQAASQAGRRRGKADDRWLWPQTFAVIRAVQPTWCILENVYGLLTLERGVVFEELCLTLEELGYDVQPFIIPAVAVNAPHRRDRVWIVAHARQQGTRRSSRPADDQRRPAAAHRADSIRPADWSPRTDRRAATAPAAGNAGGSFPDWSCDWREVALATCVCQLDDGFPRGLVRLPNGTSISQARWRKEALKALGNAIVPGVAMQIMRAIKTASA